MDRIGDSTLDIPLQYMPESQEARDCLGRIPLLLKPDYDKVKLLDFFHFLTLAEKKKTELFKKAIKSISDLINNPSDSFTHSFSKLKDEVLAPYQTRVGVAVYLIGEKSKIEKIEEFNNGILIKDLINLKVDIQALDDILSKNEKSIKTLDKNLRGRN